METHDDSDEKYLVVMNHEEQYSIWRADRDLPLGWTAVGAPRSKAECLAYIEEVWTDMRPLSLRKRMAELDAGGPGARNDAEAQRPASNSR